MHESAKMVAAISDWIDAHAAFAYRENPTLALYGRVTKVFEEYGEVLEAATGQDTGAVTGELADVALTAFCAWHHIIPDLDRLASTMQLGMGLALYAEIPENSPDIFRTLAPLGQHCGLTMQTLIGATGQNPRKGFTHDRNDVASNLSLIASEALHTITLVTSNPSKTVIAFSDRIDSVMKRAGLTV